MPGAREIRRRIRSVKNIGQITRAMELVAASKMRRAQDAARAGQSYTRTLQQMLGVLLQQTDPQTHALLRQPAITSETRTLVIVIGPDKGLCGVLVTNLLREALQTIPTHQNVEFVTVGRKAFDGLNRRHQTVVEHFALHERPHLRHILGIADLAMTNFRQGSYGKVLVVYTQFISTLRQEVRTQQLLPFPAAAPTQPASASSGTSEFTYEPSADAVLARLLPRGVEMSIYQSLLDSLASEHSARMLAMKNAGDNARDLQEELTLTYNQLRQAAITAEVAEIAAGSTV